MSQVNSLNFIFSYRTFPIEIINKYIKLLFICCFMVYLNQYIRFVYVHGEH